TNPSGDRRVVDEVMGLSPVPVQVDTVTVHDMTLGGRMADYIPAYQLEVHADETVIWAPLDPVASTAQSGWLGAYERPGRLQSADRMQIPKGAPRDFPSVEEMIQAGGGIVVQPDDFMIVEPGTKHTLTIHDAYNADSTDQDIGVPHTVAKTAD